MRAILLRTAVDYPNGMTLTSTYDDSNRLTRISTIDPDGRTLLSRSYDYEQPSTGNEDTALRYAVTDQDGNTTIYSYDGLNRLTDARTMDGGRLVEDHTYSYDAAGNRLTHRHDDGTAAFTDIYAYNAANQMVDVNGEQFTYDANGNLTGTSAGAELTYNAADQTTSITPRADHGVTSTFSYRGAGQSERITGGPGLRTGDGQPVCTIATGCTDPPDSETSTSTFLHSHLGVTTETVVTDDQTTTTAYTPLSRPCSSRSSSWCSDPLPFAGTSGVAMTQTLTHSTRSVTGSSLRAELTYNAADQTTSITPRADHGVTSTFSYRGAGQSERITGGPGVRTGDGQPVCTIATGCTDPPDSETSTSTFLHSHLGVTTETVVTDDQTTTTAYTRDPAGRLLSADGPSGPTWFFTDGLGSVIGVGDDLGQLAATYRYDPFGVTAEADGPLAAANPWRYTGAYLDATGLYKLGERYYDPQHGPFTQQDPLISLTDPLNWNRYVYVGNNPINYTNPTGLFSACENSVLRKVADYLGFFGGSGRSFAKDAVIKAFTRFAPTTTVRWFLVFQQNVDFFSVKSPFLKFWARTSLGTMAVATAYNLRCR